MRGLTLAFVVLVVASTAPGAESTQPGRNGRIAFELENDELFTIAPSGYGMRRLRRPGQYGRAPAYSPEGSRLAYVAAKGGDAGPIVVASSEGAESRRLVPYGESPTWSPDGSRIAYIRNGDELVVADTSGRTLSVHRWDRLYELSFPDWSPDGRLIAVGASESHDFCCIYVVRPDGRGLRPLVREPLGAQAAQPRWSPDGRTIGFTAIANCRAAACSGPETATTIRAAGNGRLAVAANAFAGAWSPDGRYLLLQTSGADGPRLDLFRLGNRTVVTLRRGISPGLSDWQPRCTRFGTARADRLRAGADGGPICGLSGADTLLGGRIPDRLFGGAGDDEIWAGGGGRDIVGCGAGDDVVHADAGDLVGVDCERRR
jgi:dipeptidyl aminopeptidase/acylaminoacyl peptidase